MFEGGKNMDKKLVIVVGIVILLIGLILLITGAMSYSALMDRVGWYLDITPSSTRYNQEILMYSAMSFIGFILFICGIIISIAGAVKRGKKQSQTINQFEHQQPIQQPMQQGTRYWTNCGRPIPMDAQVCPYCGNKF